MHKNYPSVKDHLRLQTGETFEELLSGLRATFRAELLEWFQKTYKELLNIRKDDELRKKRVVDTLNKNISDLKQVVEGFDEKLWSDLWTELVRDLADPLPETVVEYQSEERFKDQDSDSVKLKFQKKLKRFARTVSLPFKKDKSGWKQVIQLKKSVILKLSGVSELPVELLSNEFELISSVVGKLLEEESLPDQRIKSNASDEKPEEQPGNSTVDDEVKIDSTEKEGQKAEKKRGYHAAVIENIESHLQEAIRMLKDVETDPALSERIFTECLESAVISGTMEENRKLLETDQFDIQINEQEELLNRRQAEWLTYLKSQYSDFAIQIEIARFAFLADKARDEIRGFTHRFFRDFCYLPLENGVTRIKEISEILKKQNSDRLPAKMVQELRDDIQENLANTLLEKMSDSDAQMHLIAQIQQSITDLQLGFYSFTDSFTLAEKRTVEKGKPNVISDTVQWKKLATRYVQENALRNMDPEKREWDAFLKQIAKETEEIIQVVDVNLLTAKESEKEKDEEQSVLDIAISGTDRAVSQLEAAIKRVRERHNNYLKVVEEDLPLSIQTLAEKMLTRSYSELEMQDKALQVKATAHSWHEKIVKYYYLSLEKLELFRRYFSLKFKEYKGVAARNLGFDSESSVSTTEKRNLAEYLAKVNVKNHFPFVYKRLFSQNFEIDERFYIQPAGLYTHFEQSFEDWNLHINTNFLIVGERGSGKSLALKFIDKRFLEDQKIVKVDFRKTIYKEESLIDEISRAFGYENIKSRDELIKKIQNRRSRAILEIENIHNIFIRNVHGFEAIESFWVIMASTRDKLFWLVTCSAFAWSYYEKVFGADQYFSHIVRSDNLDREMLEKSILARHKATGYELLFLPGPATEKTRSFRKIMTDEKKKQEYLHEQYFNRLDKIAEGNMSIAMIFWMQSIKEFDDRSVKQLPTEIADLDKLEIPSRDVLFTLSALVLHENLSEEELSKALHQDIAESRLMLARLKSKGIVNESERGYKLNHLVYRQVVRLLKRRNVIH